MVWPPKRQVSEVPMGPKRIPRVSGFLLYGDIHFLLGLNNSFMKQGFFGVDGGSPDSGIPNLRSFVPESRGRRHMATPWVFAVVTPTSTIRLTLPRGLRLWVRGRHSRGAGGQCWGAQPYLQKGHRAVFHSHRLCTLYLRDPCSCPGQQIRGWKTKAWVRGLPGVGGGCRRDRRYENRLPPRPTPLSQHHTLKLPPVPLG